MFKVNKRNIGTRCEICSKLIIKTPERRHRSGVLIINFEHISRLVLVFLFLTLSRHMLTGSIFVVKTTEGAAVHFMSICSRIYESHLVELPLWIIRHLDWSMQMSFRESSSHQKQPSGGVLLKRCSEKFRKTHWKRPVPEFPFYRTPLDDCFLIIFIYQENKAKLETASFFAF